MAHDIIIILLIAVILLFQLRVFSQAKSKISLFNNVMPEQNSYKTIKVFVREDEIEKITLNEIFDEIDLYKSDDFEKRDRKKLKKKYDPFKKNNTGKNIENEENESEDYIKNIENKTLNKTSGNNIESSKIVEEIIQSFKHQSKGNLFKD